MNRRTVMKILGVGLVGGGGYAVGTESISIEQLLQMDESATATIPDYEGEVAAVEENATVVNPSPQLSGFEYEPVETSLQEGPFSQFSAEPIHDGAGDYLLVQPTDSSLTELASLLRGLHGVGETSKNAVSVDGEAVTLRGGTHGGITTLTGPYDARDAVVVVRATSPDAAESIVDDLPDLL